MDLKNIFTNCNFIFTTFFNSTLWNTNKLKTCSSPITKWKILLEMLRNGKPYLHDMLGTYISFPDILFTQKKW